VQPRSAEQRHREAHLALRRPRSAHVTPRRCPPACPAERPRLLLRGLARRRPAAYPSSGLACPIAGQGVHRRLNTCLHKNTESAELHLALRTSFVLGPILLLLPAPEPSSASPPGPAQSSPIASVDHPACGFVGGNKKTPWKQLKKTRGKNLALRLSAKLKQNTLLARQYSYVASAACSRHCTLYLNRAGRRPYAHHVCSTYSTVYHDATTENDRKPKMLAVG